MKWGRKPFAGVWSRAADRLLRLAMLLCLWNAPLPWVNVHDTLAHASDSAECLALHLARFHPDTNPFHEATLGWHVHFVLPWTVSTEGPCPADGRHHDSQEFTVAATQAGRLSESNLHPDDGLALTEWDGFTGSASLPDALRSRPRAARQTDHFLQAGSVSLRTLICVATC